MLKYKNIKTSFQPGQNYPYWNAMTIFFLEDKRCLWIIFLPTVKCVEPSFEANSRGMIELSGLSLITKIVELFNRIPVRGLKIYGDGYWENLLKYTIGLENLALMNMFGLLKIHQSDQEDTKKWIINSVHHKSFGDALIGLLANGILSLEKLGDYNDCINESKEDITGILQPYLKQFFPEYRNNLILKEPEFKDGTYYFKVILNGCWRLIAIPGTMTFDTLAYAILDAFEFDWDHLYVFRYANMFGQLVEIMHPASFDSGFSADEIRIGDVNIFPGVQIMFEYDFGDSWMFTVKLGRISDPDTKMKKTKLLESHGSPPKQYAYYDEDDWNEDEEWDEDE